VVVTAHRQLVQAEAVTTGLISAGGQATFHAADLRQLSAVQQLVARARETFGRVDILVNNAAIDLESDARVGEISDEAWDDIRATNLTAPFWLTRAVLPGMLAQGSGVIVNIASIAGLKAWPGDGAYNCAKAGLIMLTKTVAAEYARDGIRCNAICPGVIGTDMTWRSVAAAPDRAAALEGMAALHPMRRIGEPADVAQAALYLASDAARFVTGAILSVDGGMSAI
jgi:NAD(P)-dependent dehydrogenase (short-subunit alcohol dehydrogenase family)